MALLDKARIKDAFDRAAGNYDQVAILQREICQRLIERLQYIQLNPEKIVDIGAGTGQASLALNKIFPEASIINLDLSDAMLTMARSKANYDEHMHYLCGDAENIAIADQSVDFIFSSLTFQWLNELGMCFAECSRILKPEGLLLFSTFGPDTLKELKQSWAAVDSGYHVHDFIDMHHIGDALLACGFSDPVMDMEYLTVTYADLKTLMQDLKNLGAQNARVNRPKYLLGKNKWKKLQEVYEQYRANGDLPATYEVIYGHAWGANLKPGSEIHVDVKNIK